MTKKIDLPGPFTVSSNYKDACLNALIYCWKKRGLQERFKKTIWRMHGMAKRNKHQINDLVCLRWAVIGLYTIQ